MKIKCLFIVREPTDEIPELIAAWDEYSIDEHPEGWKEDCDQALETITKHYPVGITSRFITIDVSDSEIIAAMKAPTIPGKVERND